MARELPGETEILAELAAAAERAQAASVMEPRARCAYYDSESHRVAIELANGCIFAFPPALLQGRT
jgi:hypothetical protein